MKRIAALAANALLLVLVPAAASGGPLRFATAFQEKVKGDVSSGSFSETSLSNALIAAGQVLVDDAQSRAIRRELDPGQIVAGAPPKALSALDADVLVAATVSIDPAPVTMLEGRVARADAGLRARLIAVDTGQVIGAFTARGSGMDFSFPRAAEQAAARAGEALAQQVLAALATQRTTERIELLIAGVKSVQETDAVMKVVERLPEVKNVEVLATDRGLAKLALDAAGSARSIALALDRTPESGVLVFGYSDRTIKAQLAPERSFRMGMRVGGISGVKGWEAHAIGSILETALFESGFLDFAEAAQALPPERTLLLSGSVHGAGAKLELELRIVAAISKETISAGHQRCEAGALATCAAELGSQLARGLYDALIRKHAAFLGKVTLPKRSSDAERRPIEIESARFDELFPARAGAVDRPVGRLVLVNRGRLPVTNLIASVAIVGLSSAPLDTKVGALAPKATSTVEPRVVLDPDALSRLDENRAGAVQVALSYEAGELHFDETRTFPIVVLDKNALSWKEPDSAAAFVTHRSQAIQAAAKSIAATAGDADGTSVLRLPVAIFRSLAGLHYTKDPLNPFRTGGLDYVQFPTETLARGGGDCDDLAVLYAALAEAAELETLLVTTREHIFVAVDSGLPVRNALLLAADPTMVLEHEGRAFIPIETTKVGRPFLEAWKEAAAEIASARSKRGELETIDPRAAWKRFAPVELVSAGVPSPRVDPGPAEAITREVDAIEAARLEALESRLRALGGDPNRQGLLLAMVGDASGARARFEAAVTAGKDVAAAKNNLGNLGLLEAKPAEALNRYQEALRLAPKRAEIHLNAAIAAWYAGDDASFGDHIARCLDLGGEAMVDELGRSGLSGLRGGDGSLRAGAELARRVAELRGKTRVETKGEERGAGLPVATMLHWL